jgi:capsid protein
MVPRGRLARPLHLAGNAAHRQSIAIDRDGEVFFRATAQTTGYPALQLILAHRIGDARSSIYEPSNPAAREGGQNVIDGVVVNPQLRPIFYRYLMGDGIDPSARFEDIPAQQLIHVGEASQGDELRYVTPLAPSINHLRDVGDAVGFEKMAIKISSYIALAIKSSEPARRRLLRRGHALGQQPGQQRGHRGKPRQRRRRYPAPRDG